MVISRRALMSLLRGLMVVENLGDVHDQINRLHDLLEIPRPKGGFAEGWTDRDWQNVGGT